MSINRRALVALTLAVSALAFVLLFWAVALLLVFSHSMPMPKTVGASSASPVITWIVGFLGVVAGWFVSHLLTLSRDKRTRRGSFVGCLLQWRTALERCAPDDREGVWKAYMAGVNTYRLELGKIREDFLHNPLFREKTNQLGSLQQSAIWKERDQRTVPCTLIDDIADLVESRDRHVEGEMKNSVREYVSETLGR
jgi:hypothetical protein